MTRWLPLLVFCLSVGTTRGVLFYATGDPAYNTNAPTGTLAESGWQFQGHWSVYVGTAIAPHYFITAKHVGGKVGDPFTLGGSVYTTTAAVEHPLADLRIWRVREPLPVAAQLYTRQDEQGRRLVVFGRGCQRGDAVTVTSRYGHELKGWYWGKEDSLPRWGENTVAAVFYEETAQAHGLAVAFRGNGLANEATLGAGDSGGGVFIQDGTSWKLAGVNWAADGCYNTGTDGNGFYAALFDVGGLFGGGPDDWTFVAESPLRQPSYFYATRISSYVDWIQEVMAETTPPEVLAADEAGGAYGVVADAAVDAEARVARVPRASGSRFFRLRDTFPRRILGVSFEGDGLVLRYE